MGFFARIEIPLSAYSPGTTRGYRRYDITDIDVLGLRLDHDLRAEFVAGDCKSSPETRLFDRVFWLKGAMDYFGAAKGYLVTSRGAVLPRQVANKLGIIALSEDDLSDSETRLGIDSSWFGSCDPSTANQQNTFRLDLKKSFKSELNYLTYRYWADPVHYQIKRLITVGKGLAEKAEPNLEAFRWLLAESLIRFSLSVSLMCGRVGGVKDPEMGDVISTELYGGALEKKEREEIVKSMTAFIQSYLREATLDRDIIISPDSFKLDPDYVPGLAEIAYRFTSVPLAAKEVPRFLDFACYEFLLKKKPVDLSNSKLRFAADNVLIAKLAKDVIDFWVKTCKLEVDTFQPLLVS
jgi:hypothetical protein